MSGPNDLIAVAASQIGTTENPPGSNRTKYGDWYGMNGVSWCSIYVAWCLNFIGIDARKVVTPDYAGCSAALAGWYRIGRGVSTANLQPGDIVYYHFPHEHAGANHTGIVEKVYADHITAIEGNTSGGGSQAHGGMVMRRDRSKSLILGGGRPPYSATPPPVPQAPAPAVNLPHRDLIGFGAQGRLVEIAQWELAVISGAQFTDESGKYGLHTAQAIINLGKMLNKNWDGLRIDTEQWNAIDFLYMSKGNQPVLY